MEELSAKPNTLVRSTFTEVISDVIHVHGVQEYTLTRHMPHPSVNDALLCKKYELLKAYFSPVYLKNCTLTDFSASGGFFCFWALSQQAQHVNAIDIDDENIEVIKQVNHFWGSQNLNILKTNWSDWDKQANVVLAFELCKWIYHRSTPPQQLVNIVNKLSLLTHDMLIVEWIDPIDPVFQWVEQPDYDKENNKATYTSEYFEQALRKCFARYECVGELTATRKLYVAYKNIHPIDRTCPLPLQCPLEQVIYSRLLCRHKNIDYWSTIYDCKDAYLKQTSSHLAFHEGVILSKLKGRAGYFPKAYGFDQQNGYSTVMIERINGEPLQLYSKNLQEDLGSFIRFALHLLNILQILKEEKIVHRDIRADNILVRNHRPVLIDFGWAEMPQMPIFTPLILGDISRPADKSFCDVYSIGKLLQKMNSKHYKGVDLILNLMTEEDATLRLVDITILTGLFQVIDRIYAN